VLPPSLLTTLGPPLRSAPSAPQAPSCARAGVMEVLHGDAAAQGMLPRWEAATSTEQVSQAVSSIRARGAESNASAPIPAHLCEWLPYFYEVRRANGSLGSAFCVLFSGFWVLWGAGADGRVAPHGPLPFCGFRVLVLWVLRSVGPGFWVLGPRRTHPDPPPGGVG